MKPLLDIIIPTYNQPQLLQQCINSIFGSLIQGDMVRVIVVNNGNAGLQQVFKNTPVKWIQPDKNLGWEGGLIEGLKHSDAEFVMFANDDIRFLQGDKKWIWKALSAFNDPTVGAVGPSSNYVMGMQNIFADSVEVLLNVKYLIGFCYLLRRSALEKAGGVDDSLPGGDDIDLSIRLRNASYKLLARRDWFVFHHGSVTGNSVQAGYWNSPAMQERTNLALIRKHGMLKFWETMVTGWMSAESYNPGYYGVEDVEGQICAEHVLGDKILELGCGGRKTVPQAVGVDLHAPGDAIPYVTVGDETCVSDLTGDVSVSLPVPPGSQDTIIARHILEHCQDPLGTLSVWNEALRVGGKLIIAVPNQELGNTILMNPEHVNSFVPTSLIRLLKAAGFTVDRFFPAVNGVSFIIVADKAVDVSADPVKETVAPKAARLEVVA